jgi:hypothetical protein
METETFSGKTVAGGGNRLLCSLVISQGNNVSLQAAVRQNCFVRV